MEEIAAVIEVLERLADVDALPEMVLRSRALVEGIAPGVARIEIHEVSCSCGGVTQTAPSQVQLSLLEVEVARHLGGVPGVRRWGRCLGRVHASFEAWVAAAALACGEDPLRAAREHLQRVAVWRGLQDPTRRALTDADVVEESVSRLNAAGPLQRDLREVVASVVAPWSSETMAALVAQLGRDRLAVLVDEARGAGGSRARGASWVCAVAYMRVVGELRLLEAWGRVVGNVPGQGRGVSLVVVDEVVANALRVSHGVAGVALGEESDELAQLVGVIAAGELESGYQGRVPDGPHAFERVFEDLLERAVESAHALLVVT